MQPTRRSTRAYFWPCAICCDTGWRSGGLFLIWIATHLTPEERAPYIQIARWYGCEAEALYFDVPLEICLERNRRRHRVVPEDAMERMAAKLVPPDVAEGFTRVTVAP